MEPSTGTKVTSDPESLNQPKNENPGIVTSDSLAAESVREGGSFAANSDSRGPMDQPAKGSTAANTDTSNATVLDPAPDAEARQANEAWNEQEQFNAGSKLRGGGEPIHDNATSSMGESQIPKGKNLQEGGFDEDAPNASWTTDIGGKNDPGRAALESIEARGASAAGGAGPTQREITDDGQYDALGDTSA